MTTFSKIIIMIVVLISLWYGLVLSFNIPQYIVPSPLDVFYVITTNHSLIKKHLLTTFREATLGFLLANVISISIAVYIGFNRSIESFIMPIAIFLKTIPIIAIAPLLMLWLGSGEQARVATSALICFFPALVNMIRGIKSINPELISLFSLYETNFINKFRYLIIPSTMPYIFSSLKISSSLAIVGALVGEFLGSNKGMGFLIITNYYSVNTPMVFAAVLLVSFMGILFYYIIHFAEYKLVTWADSIE